MQAVPLPIFQEREPPSTLTGLPLLRLGFRPFYLCGAGLAAIGVPLWMAMLMGWIALAPSLAPWLWHAHEMLFGFAVAIIVGFLMTAGKAWTGLATPRGPALGALALLWLGARVAAFTGPYALYAALDLALLPIVAIVLTRLLLRSRNHRNLPLAGLLALLSGANLAFHLAAMNVLPLSALTPLHAALALIVLIECVMAGRVIPGFTMSATPGLKLASPPWLERLTLGSTGLGLALWVFQAPALPTAVLLTLAAALHLQRALRWRPWVARQRPILWILHAAYAWIPLGLGLLAAAQAGGVPVSAAVHAFAVGATGGLIIGMITRTARGHTGRTLQPSGVEVLAYALVMLAAALRVLLPLVAPSIYLPALLGAALAWGGAFSIYLWVYTPWLLRQRLDGKDG
jgi:uncharacterized protein involved in response to NO